MPWEALCRIKRYGPVTTDPFGVRLQLLSHRRRTLAGGKSTAGAIRGLSASKLMFLRTYPGMSMVKDASQSRSLLGPTILVGWEVRPSLSVSQNGDRPKYCCSCSILRLWNDQTRPERQDTQVGGEKPSRSDRLESFLTLRRIRSCPASVATSSCSPTYVGEWNARSILTRCWIAGDCANGSTYESKR